MSKPKNPLLNMPEIHQARLADWLLGGMTYYEANLLVQKEFNVAPSSSLGRYSRFWEQVCVPMLLQRRKRMAGTAAERAQEAEKNPAEFDRATLDALQQRAYELAENPQSDAKDVKSILMLLLKAKDQSLDERRITLDEQKFQFDAAKACLTRLPELKAISTNKELSDDQKLEQARLALFGSAPQ